MKICCNATKVVFNSISTMWVFSLETGMPIHNWNLQFKENNYDKCMYFTFKCKTGSKINKEDNTSNKQKLLFIKKLVVCLSVGYSMLGSDDLIAVMTDICLAVWDIQSGQQVDINSLTCDNMDKGQI